MSETPFNIASHLDTDKKIHDFLVESADTGTEEEFYHAIEIAGKARANNKTAFQRYLYKASQIVDSWPKWKRDVLGK